MSCKEQTAAIVECARRGENPNVALREHLETCPDCQSRWRAERDLSVHFGVMAGVAEASESSTRARRDARAALLIATFAAERTKLTLVKPVRRLSPAWALSAAAALFLAIGVGYGVGNRTRHRATSPAIRTHGVGGTDTVLYEVSADAGSLSGDDFIAVPYALPLAPGETVRIVHSELYPQALASMGIDVDGGLLDGDDATAISADVVMGQDGLPRAVRIADTTDF